MMRADLERLHKYMLEIEGVDAISDEMRAVVEGTIGLSWCTSCRRRSCRVDYADRGPRQNHHLWPEG
jgi:hypothetical protein